MITDAEIEALTAAVVRERDGSIPQFDDMIIVRNLAPRLISERASLLVQIATLEAERDAATAEKVRAQQAYFAHNEAICQTLGKLLGFPWYKDCPDNFPNATDADGICPGELVGEDMVRLAAAEIKRLRATLAERDAELHRQGESATEFLRRLELADAEIGRLIANALPPTPQTGETRTVPLVPTEAQWGGLARDIVMWWGCDDWSTGASLYHYLARRNIQVPDWLLALIPDNDLTPVSDNLAAAIYRAMVEKAPPVETPNVE